MVVAEATSLDDLMKTHLNAGAFQLPSGPAQFMEIVDKTTGLVWMCASPMEPSQFDALEFEPHLVKVGIAQTTVDRSAFLYSPESPTEPVRERVINGYLFINVADPSKPMMSPHPAGPAEVIVDKGHVIGFDAGRTVTILSVLQGDFVELLGVQEEDFSRVLPPGGSLRTVELDQPWVIRLPTPTHSFFWFSDTDLRSFQGPITLPASF